MKEIKILYHLIDSRAGIEAMNIVTCDLNDIDEDWERYIRLSSVDPNEICQEANKGNYGKHCVVSKDNIIMWEWHGLNDWDVKHGKI